MRVSKVAKKFLLADLCLGLIITTITWMTLGTEGLAAKYCSLTHARSCDDIEWSESHVDERTSRKTEEDEDEAEKSRRSIRLRYGL